MRTRLQPHEYDGRPWTVRLEHATSREGHERGGGCRHVEDDLRLALAQHRAEPAAEEGGRCRRELHARQDVGAVTRANQCHIVRFRQRATETECELFYAFIWRSRQVFAYDAYASNGRWSSYKRGHAGSSTRARRRITCRSGAFSPTTLHTPSPARTATAPTAAQIN